MLSLGRLARVHLEPGTRETVFPYGKGWCKGSALRVVEKIEVM